MRKLLMGNMLLGSQSTKFYYTLLAIVTFLIFSLCFIYIIAPFEYVASAMDQCQVLTDYVDALKTLPYFSIVICLIRYSWRPFLTLIILPAGVVALFYSSNFIIQLFRCRLWFYTKFQTVDEIVDRHHIECRPLGSIDVPLPSKILLKQLLAGLWHIHGRIYHGYEVKGYEKLPPEGPCLIVYYHGTLPLDIYHFVASMYVEHNRLFTPIVDHFLMRIPGIQAFLKIAGAETGTVESCVQDLTQRNAAIIVSPGGVREALFSDENYDLIWKKRVGFAKISIEANLPIYPMHTCNIRESIRVVKFGRSIWRKIYEVTRLPIAIFYGYFPVKLVSHIGDPIYPEKDETPEEFADRVRENLTRLIKKHQIIPGSITAALIQRLPQSFQTLFFRLFPTNIAGMDNLHND